MILLPVRTTGGAARAAGEPRAMKRASADAEIYLIETPIDIGRRMKIRARVKEDCGRAGSSIAGKGPGRHCGRAGWGGAPAGPVQIMIQSGGSGPAFRHGGGVRLRNRGARGPGGWNGLRLQSSQHGA